MCLFISLLADWFFIPLLLPMLNLIAMKDRNRSVLLFTTCFDIVPCLCPMRPVGAITRLPRYHTQGTRDNERPERRSRQPSKGSSPAAKGMAYAARDCVGIYLTSHVYSTCIATRLAKWMITYHRRWLMVEDQCWKEWLQTKSFGSQVWNTVNKDMPEIVISI